MKDQLDKLIIVGVLLLSFGMLWCFRADHDLSVFTQGCITTLLGGLLGLVRATPATQHPTQHNTITAATVEANTEVKP